MGIYTECHGDTYIHRLYGMFILVFKACNLEYKQANSRIILKCIKFILSKTHIHEQSVAIDGAYH